MTDEITEAKITVGFNLLDKPSSVTAPLQGPNPIYCPACGREVKEGDGCVLYLSAEAHKKGIPWSCENCPNVKFTKSLEQLTLDEVVQA